MRHGGLVMNTLHQAQEARTIYLSLCNARTRRDWKAVENQISRLGNLVMELMEVDAAPKT